jgi:hypothetical protein
MTRLRKYLKSIALKPDSIFSLSVVAPYTRSIMVKAERFRSTTREGCGIALSPTARTTIPASKPREPDKRLFIDPATLMPTRRECRRQAQIDLQRTVGMKIRRRLRFINATYH